jgi:hypothetical protein
MFACLTLKPSKLPRQHVKHSLASSNQSRKLRTAATSHVKNENKITPNRRGRQKQKVLLSRNHLANENVIFTITYVARGTKLGGKRSFTAWSRSVEICIQLIISCGAAVEGFTVNDTVDDLKADSIALIQNVSIFG